MCLGDSVSLQIEIVASYGNLTIQWRHEADLLDDSEHFALNEDKTVLTIYNALPPHGGFYQAIVSDLRNTEYVIFNVEVHGKTNLFFLAQLFEGLKAESRYALNKSIFSRRCN